MNMNFVNLPGYTTSASLQTPRSDGWDNLRAQRREHMENAQWWKRRYQSWGSSLALVWFRAEANSHRRCSRVLWQHGVN